MSGSSGNPIWMYLFGAIIVAMVGLFFFMGGSVDDIQRFIASPSTGFSGFGGGGGIENPVKGVLDGVGAVGDSIGGALRGFGR